MTRAVRRVVAALTGLIVIVALLVLGLRQNHDGDAPAPVSSAAPQRLDRLYSPDSFWNTPIPEDAPTDQESTARIAVGLIGPARSSNLANSQEWGMPMVVADLNSPWYTVGCRRFNCHDVVRVRIPRGARTSTGTDSHLAVVDPERGLELDMWQARYDSPSDTWSAGSRFLTRIDAKGAICNAGKRCNGAVAGGFAALGGVVFPEEIRRGRIEHAVALTTPATAGGIITCPASHTDGRRADGSGLPLGSRVQLDPTFDVARQGWPRWLRVIARALQDYGGLVVDTAGSLSLRGEAVSDRDLSWRSVGVPDTPSLDRLPWQRFRLIAMQRC